MKIAAITITYNDDYKFNEWFQHYSEYKDELYLHIIVDNNSNKEWLKKVQETFTESHIIQRTSNGGCTGAYNDGIKYALSVSEVDAIMLIGNDVRLKMGASTILYDRLFKEFKMGMIAPIILKKDSMIAEDFGCNISKALIMEPHGCGLNLQSVNESINYCEAVAGGMNLSKREFYETVGLQDDNLFMYSDEVDMGLRAKKCGFTMAAISEAISWHQHINKVTNSNRRDSYTAYLYSRNKVYLSKKHFGFKKVAYVFLYYLLKSIKNVILSMVIRRKNNLDNYNYHFYMLLGCLMGLVGNMKPNRFSKPKNEL